MSWQGDKFRTNLHGINLGGVKHVLQSTAYLEKLFWLVVILCGLTASLLLVRKQIDSWNEDPVTRSTEQRQVSEFPFPAVTLCHPGFNRFDFVAKYLNLMEPEEVDRRLKDVKKRFMKQVVHEQGAYTKSPTKLYHDYDDECLHTRRKFYNVSCSLTEQIVLAQRQRQTGYEAMVEDFVSKLIQSDKGKYDAMREFVGQMEQDAQDYLKGNHLTMNSSELLPLPTEENWSTLYHIAWIRVAVLSFGFSSKLGLIKSDKTENINSLLNMKTHRPGSLYSKLYSVYTKNALYRVPDDWELAEGYYGNFTKSFSLPGIGMSPIDIIPLLMMTSFDNLSKDRVELDWSNSWTVENQANRYLATLPRSAYLCIQELREQNPVGHDYHEPSPCQSGLPLTDHCQSWCDIFRELDQVLDRKVLLALMKPAMVQRGVVPVPKPADSEIQEFIYKQMFPDSISLSAKGAKRSISADTPLVIYCKDTFREQWKGSRIGFGLANKFCQDFFSSPTDMGFCLTKNWRADTNLKVQKSTSAFLENFDSFTGPLLYSHPNIREGVVTLVIDTQKRHTLPRKSSMNKDKDDILNKINLQLHQTNSVGQMVTSQDFSRAMEVLTLKSGHEYFIEITPEGSDVTNRFRDSLSPEQHPCHLDVLVHDLELFQTYSYANCYYECRVKYAADICACVPWDYLSNLDYPLCDVIGGTCFRNMIQNATFTTNLPCSCPRACTEVQYSKRLERVIDLNEPQNEWFPSFFACGRLCEYLTNANGTIRDPSLLDVVRYYDYYSDDQITEYNRGAKAFKDIIVIHLQFQSPKMVSTILDARATWIEKLAEFGGTFGLLTQITGLSILSLIQFLTLSGKTLWHIFSPKPLVTIINQSSKKN
ncbi:hypothetical protein TCAL_14586 [Tigriopus californicus]|uniref:Uncharacterized protein n=1 Tax=Tigriopus californicus TaxID=6832 RepID=A0A553PBV7_TIGCA|nr:uncharacterized protein LOC131892915 [Tigriopus californicus]TRY75168.1 hypothetical protein TCAL_14586 [Tigriopus californicus]